MDITDPGSIEAAQAQVRAWTDRLHRLVNVSGLLHDTQGLSPERRLEAVSQDSLRRVFDVNAFGPILVARAFEGLIIHDEPAVLAKQLTVVALHPGTVETELSAPFRRNVRPEKLCSAQRSAQLLLTVMAGLTPADSGGFFAYDGARIPW